MKLTGLYPLYKELTKKIETYCVFRFIKNGVEFDIFFDIGVAPYKLGFLIIGEDFELWLKVEKGFIIDTNLSKEDYKRLVDVLGLKYDKENKFSTFAFFEEFNNKIPTSIPDRPKRQVINLFVRFFNLEENDKLYYDGIIEWDKTETPKRRSPENLEKTRLLLPDLYESIKNKNISVRYSATRKD